MITSAFENWVISIRELNQESRLKPYAVGEYLVSVQPLFSELNKVRVKCPESGDWEGYIIASQFRDGRWIYKVSLTEDPKEHETFDNWVPEGWLESIK